MVCSHSLQPIWSCILHSKLISIDKIPSVYNIFHSCFWCFLYPGRNWSRNNPSIPSHPINIMPGPFCVPLIFKHFLRVLSLDPLFSDLDPLISDGLWGPIYLDRTPCFNHAPLTLLHSLVFTQLMKTMLTECYEWVIFTWCKQNMCM